MDRYKQVIIEIDGLPKEKNTYFTGWNNPETNKPMILGSNYFNGKEFEMEEKHDAQPEWYLIEEITTSDQTDWKEKYEVLIKLIDILDKECDENFW